jgi:hypothetical protein
MYIFSQLITRSGIGNNIPLKKRRQKAMAGIGLDGVLLEHPKMT